MAIYSTTGNLAICVGPNLLSPPEGHTLPLDVLGQVMGKLRSVYQPATAFRPHRSVAAQRYLAAVSPEQTFVGELLGRAAPQLQLSAQKRGSGVQKTVLEPLFSHLGGNQQWLLVCR